LAAPDLRQSGTLFALFGKLTAHAGKADELVALLTGGAGVADNPACRLYVVNRSDAEPDAVWVYELWDHEEAHRESLEDPAVRQAIARGRPLIAGISGQVRMRAVGGKGV
jgi:quinol monooxygenase YgiN